MAEAPQEEKAYICGKCKKEKRKDQGSFVLDGTTFCCEECCKKGEKDKGKDDKVCEFC